MWETSGRLLRLLSLLQTRREWTGAELAGRLDVTVRTIRRDVERLRALGYPVDAARGAAGYRLGPGAEVPPLLLDDEEAVAVAMGLRTAVGGTITGIEEASVRALTKLEQLLPSRLRHRINTLQSVTVPISQGGPTVGADLLTAVATAARNHEQLRFDYVNHDGSERRRTTEPHRLVSSGRRWYLVAWDVDRDDWRTFRLDRMRPRTPTGPRFRPRDLPADDVSSFTARGISVRPYRYHAVLTLHGSLEAVTERVPPTIGVVEAIDRRRCRLETGSDSLEELAVWVALFGFEFEVHEPSELRDVIETLAGRLSRASAESSRAADTRPVR
ncbi:helix-turn-helix transcriptional regulator [Phytoactinopolyspora mesophila]|uniref:WYL domain-containing protein n=1 Tax=Phytoactinopolyspora mesophila TaxID=2650750 RepID=A0A7K3MCF3_9ACTN|nr:YafY family protein [Phytoactinopolyspora mesophila]NDL60717.1 WYL domain-containing protein [Phytoactinopolyspora mesophila]